MCACYCYCYWYWYCYCYCYCYCDVYRYCVILRYVGIFYLQYIRTFTVVCGQNTDAARFSTSDIWYATRLKQIVKAVFLDEFRCKFQRHFRCKLVCLPSVFTLNFTNKENENYSFSVLLFFTFQYFLSIFCILLLTF